MNRAGPWAVLLAVALALALTGCSERVSQAGFERVEQDMTREQVVAILGEPGESSAVSLGGLNGETAIWRSEDIRIIVSFAQGRVVLATFKNMSQTGEPEQ